MSYFLYPLVATLPFILAGCSSKTDVPSTVAAAGQPQHTVNIITNVDPSVTITYTYTIATTGDSGYTSTQSGTYCNIAQFTVPEDASNAYTITVVGGNGTGSLNVLSTSSAVIDIAYNGDAFTMIQLPAANQVLIVGNYDSTSHIFTITGTPTPDGAPGPTTVSETSPTLQPGQGWTVSLPVCTDPSLPYTLEADDTYACNFAMPPLDEVILLCDTSPPSFQTCAPMPYSLTIFNSDTSSHTFLIQSNLASYADITSSVPSGSYQIIQIPTNTNASAYTIKVTDNPAQTLDFYMPENPIAIVYDGTTFTLSPPATYPLDFVNADPNNSYTFNVTLGTIPYPVGSTPEIGAGQAAQLQLPVNVDPSAYSLGISGINGPTGPSSTPFPMYPSESSIGYDGSTVTVTGAQHPPTLLVVNTDTTSNTFQVTGNSTSVPSFALSTTLSAPVILPVTDDSSPYTMTINGTVQPNTFAMPAENIVYTYDGINNSVGSAVTLNITNSYYSTITFTVTAAGANTVTLAKAAVPSYSTIPSVVIIPNLTENGVGLTYTINDGSGHSQTFQITHPTIVIIYSVSQTYTITQQ